MKLSIASFLVMSSVLATTVCASLAEAQERPSAMNWALCLGGQCRQLPNAPVPFAACVVTPEKDTGNGTVERVVICRSAGGTGAMGLRCVRDAETGAAASLVTPQGSMVLLCAPKDKGEET